MTDVLSDIDASSDAELISRVRGGDVAAYGDLFSRHVDAANRLGRQLARGPDVDDLVSEAFAKVLHVLQGGGGPDVAFRAYLLTAVRRLHVDKIRAGAKLQTSDDMSQFDPGIPFQDTAVAEFENGAAAKAFASLPERWQLVLWHLEVEGQKPAEIAPLLGMSANSVSALAYRAREGLRQAFLTMHLADISAEQCRWVNEHLGAYVRKGLSRRDTGKVEEHLDECRRCTAMYLELTEVNSNLSAIIGPLLLGAAAAGYLASTGTAGAAGLFGLVGRARDTISASAGAATAGAVAAGVVALATAGFLIANAGDQDVVIGADNPITATRSTSPNAAPPPELPTSDSPESGGSDKTPTTSSPATQGVIVPIGDLASPTTSSTAGSTATATTTAPGDAPSGNPSTGQATPPTHPSTGSTSTAPSNPPSAATAPSEDPTTMPPASTPPAKTPPVTTPPPRTTSPTTAPPTTTPPTTTPPATTPPPTASFRIGTMTVAPGGTTLSIPLTNLRPDLVSLSVDLQSSQTTFKEEPTADCSIVTTRHAECSPTIAALGAGMTAVRMAAPESFTVVLPLSFPDDMSSDELIVKVTARDYEEQKVDDNTSDPYRFDPAVPDDFAMGSFQDVAHAGVVDGRDLYHLTSQITLPEGVDALSFDVSSNATFVERTGDDCANVSQTRVRCGNLSDDSTVQFIGSLPHGTSDTVTTITLAVPAAYQDLDATDNFASSALTPPAPLPPEAALEFDGLHQTGDADDNDTVDVYRLRGVVSGLPEDVDEIFLDLSGTNVSADARFGEPTGDGHVDCSYVSDTRVRCRDLASAADGTFGIDFVVHLAEGSADRVTIALAVPTGYTDTDLGNNADSVDVGPPPPPLPIEHDFVMGALVQSGDNVDATFEVSSRISNVPTDVPELFFDVTKTGGATIALTGNGADCVLTGDRAHCTNINRDFDLNFTVTLQDTDPETITVRLVVPPGYSDSTGDNSDDITLDPDDPPAEALQVNDDDVVVDDTLGANVQVTVTVTNIAPTATNLYFTIVANETTLDGDGCTAEGSERKRVQCPATSTDGTTTVTLDLKQPPGQTEGGEEVTLFVSSIGFDAATRTRILFWVNTND